MTARELEQALLSRCMNAARNMALTAQDQREANVFALAGMVLRSQFARESNNLMRASEPYFTKHPSERLTPSDIVKKGWIQSLPRLRDMLSQQLKSCP